MSWLKAGRATAIGSVPYDNVESALRLLADCLPYWPHWPQLPGSSDEEGFVLQYIQPLIKFNLIEKRKNDLVFRRDQADWQDNLLRFYEAYFSFKEGSETEIFALNGKAFVGLNAFCSSFSSYFPLAEGVKGQLSGPLSLGLDIKDETGKDCFYDRELLDLLLKCLETQGIMQVKKLKKLGLPVMLFIDDPAIFLLGTAGYITLTDEEIQAALLALIKPLQEVGAKVGVHVCSKSQWPVLLELPLDVISFDAYHFFDSMALYSAELLAYLNKGGKIAWGIVPTEEEAVNLSPDDLQSLIRTQVKELADRGIEPELLFKNIIWTPSCGTGTLQEKTTEHIYHLLRGVSR